VHSRWYNKVGADKESSYAANRPTISDIFLLVVWTYCKKKKTRHVTKFFIWRYTTHVDGWNRRNIRSVSAKMCDVCSPCIVFIVCHATCAMSVAQCVKFFADIVTFERLAICKYIFLRFGLCEVCPGQMHHIPKTVCLPSQIIIYMTGHGFEM